MGLDVVTKITNSLNKEIGHMIVDKVKGTRNFHYQITITQEELKEIETNVRNNIKKQDFTFERKEKIGWTIIAITLK